MSESKPESPDYLAFVAKGAVSRNATLTEAQHHLLSMSTPPREIRETDGRGGRVKYIDTAYTIRNLNLCFGWRWTFEVLSEELVMWAGKPFEVRVHGRLSVVLHDGTTISKDQYGCVQLQFNRNGEPVSIGDAYKGAASDCLKKCGSLLGIGLDVYDNDSPVYGGAPISAARKELPAAEPEVQQEPAQPTHEPPPGQVFTQSNPIATKPAEPTNGNGNHVITESEARATWTALANKIAALKPLSEMARKEKADTLKANSISGLHDVQAIMAKAVALKESIDTLEAISQ